MRDFARTSWSVMNQPDPGGRRKGQRAFSLVELVIVVVIIGIISAIAVPRISTAARGAKSEALMATLANVRKAVDVYYAEHGKYPGYRPGTTTPDNTQFIKQLMEYSSETGATNDVGTSIFIYGPYLRPPFPTNPLNNLSNVVVKATKAVADPAKGSVGWVAVLADGAFYISTTTAELNEVGILDTIKIDIMLR